MNNVVFTIPLPPNFKGQARYPLYAYEERETRASGHRSRPLRQVKKNRWRGIRRPFHVRRNRRHHPAPAEMSSRMHSTCQRRIRLVGFSMAVLDGEVAVPRISAFGPGGPATRYSRVEIPSQAGGERPASRRRAVTVGPYATEDGEPRQDRKVAAVSRPPPGAVGISGPSPEPDRAAGRRSSNKGARPC